MAARKKQEWYDDPAEYRRTDNRKWDHNHNEERHEKIKQRWESTTQRRKK